MSTSCGWESKGMGMAHSAGGWNAGCAGKTVISLDNACSIPERLRDVLCMWRRYTNRIPLPLVFCFLWRRQQVPAVNTFPRSPTAAAWCVNAAVSKAVWWPWPLTLKVVSESRVTLPIVVFLGFFVLDLGPMYATDRRQTASSLNAPAY